MLTELQLHFQHWLYHHPLGAEGKGQVENEQDPISAFTKRLGQKLMFKIIADWAEHFPRRSQNLNLITKLSIVRKENLEQ